MKEIKVPLNDGCDLVAVCTDDEPNTIRIRVMGNGSVQELIEVCPSCDEEIFYVDINIADGEREGYVIFNKNKKPRRA